MSTFDSTKEQLSKIIDQIHEGKIQLPDFQRGWVWDDDHIRSLLISITKSFPIGSIMLLETGGSVRFQIRPIEGVETKGLEDKAESLILDGQQRLTSLYQVLKMTKPVKTRDSQGKQVERYYYFDIEKAMSGEFDLEDTLIGLDETKMLKKNFGRDIVLDLSTQEQEYKNFFFPCNQILNSDKWEEGLTQYDKDKLLKYMEFRKRILSPFREYLLPIIELKKETSKEAVCLVFEKVNTGGVPLSVFELMTASYAADSFNLRMDWYGDSDKKIPGKIHSFSSHPLLKDIEPTEFLQGLSLLYTDDKKKEDIKTGKTGKQITPVSAKREHVLILPLNAYKKWGPELVNGFIEANRFLKREGFYHPKFLPYRSQIIPLAAVLVNLRERWLEPVINKKISKWFWCGVLGELYGGAVETRIALDYQDLLAQILNDSAEPKTVIDAGFRETRLDSLRSRTSAAYRGLYTLLQREGCHDFYWKSKITDLDREETRIDIHHIFPKDWCKKQGISDKIYNSIVNKTPISYKANRMIGGNAPSEYLDKLKNDKNVKISDREQDEILKSHIINPELLRKDNFDEFMTDRKHKFIKIIERVMDKKVAPDGGVSDIYGEETDDEEDVPEE